MKLVHLSDVHIWRYSVNPIRLWGKRAVGMAELFTGRARRFRLERMAEVVDRIAAIEYEAFQRMVEHQFDLLFDGMAKRWPVESVRLVHRIGVVKVNEPSLWVEVVAPHRGEAFAACQWLIDEMKRVVPIWKKPVVSP